MNRIAREMNYDVLATAHNLDDEVAVLMGNVMNWQTEQLTRQAPVLEAEPGFARKVKPFCRFYERETAAYALWRVNPLDRTTPQPLPAGPSPWMTPAGPPWIRPWAISSNAMAKVPSCAWAKPSI
jgi:hypothetical protein